MKIETFARRFLDPKNIKKAVEIWNDFISDVDVVEKFDCSPHIYKISEFDKILEDYSPSEIVNLTINMEIPSDWERYKYYADDEDNLFEGFNYIEDYSVFCKYINTYEWDDLYVFAIENEYKI